MVEVTPPKSIVMHIMWILIPKDGVVIHNVVHTLWIDYMRVICRSTPKPSPGSNA